MGMMEATVKLSSAVGKAETGTMLGDGTVVFSMEHSEEADLLLFSHSVMSHSLQPHRLQHSRLLCPLFQGVCSDSCPLSW